VSPTVLLADDEPLVRTGLRALLEQQGITVAGEAADGAEVLPAVRRTRPDVVLMDVRMPGTDGIEATRQLLAELAEPPKVLVVTTFDNDDYVHEALLAGASGFLLKRARKEEIAHAVRTVAAGESLLSPAATMALIERFLAQPEPRSGGYLSGLSELTAREREITVLVGAGLSNNEIAEQLFISPATAKTHINRAMMKTGARDRAQLVVFAYENGLVVPRGRST